MAFDTLISAPVVSGQEHTRDQMIAKLVAPDDALRKRFERYPRFDPADRIERRWQRRAKAINAKHERQHQEDMQWLHDHLTELRDGSNQRVLIHLAVEADLAPEQPSKAVNQLIERYDNTISAATREGWRRSWRSMQCLLPHEEEARNSFSYSMIVGFAGLALDIEDGLDLASLGPEDAHQVARYATRGLDRFPPWLNALITRQRTAVVEVFGKCIHADFAFQAEGPGTHNVLHLLRHASSGVREICVPIVLELLTKGNPPRVDTLKDCLEALLATPSTHEAIGRLAPLRCDFGPGEREQLSLWWCVWLGVDPVPALNRLEDAIATEPGSADDLVLVFADRLLRLAEDAQLGFAFPEEPSERARLTKIVISHVRPDDDIRHHDAHMYGPRDHAESLRHYLLDLLAGTPGREAYNGLNAIVAVPSLASWRDYLLSLAERQLGQDANARNSEVAERLINLYKKHGLTTMSHLKQAGSTGRDESAPVLIDFAIVTAIEVERRAVCSAFGLGDEHRVKEGSRVYWRGQLRLPSGDAYEIVVAQAADMANIDAALATSDLLHRWTPGAALMVGIAATTNPKEADLGDVVVGSDVYYYERGKVVATGTKPEPKMVPADATLWNNIKALPEWVADLAVPRPDGTHSAPRPRYGVIASGEKVLADEAVRDQIAAGHRKIVALEMEGYGFSRAVWQSFDHVHHLVIRGICDDGSQRKNDAWHGYAAASAASLAKHFLLDRPLPPRNVMTAGQ